MRTPMPREYIKSIKQMWDHVLSGKSIRTATSPRTASKLKNLIDRGYTWDDVAGCYEEGMSADTLCYTALNTLKIDAPTAGLEPPREPVPIPSQEAQKPEPVSEHESVKPPREEPVSRPAASPPTDVITISRMPTYAEHWRLKKEAEREVRKTEMEVGRRMVLFVQKWLDEVGAVFTTKTKIRTERAKCSCGQEYVSTTTRIEPMARVTPGDIIRMADYAHRMQRLSLGMATNISAIQGNDSSGDVGHAVAQVHEAYKVAILSAVGAGEVSRAVAEGLWKTVYETLKQGELVA